MTERAAELTAAQVMTITEHLGMYEAEVQRLRWFLSDVLDLADDHINPETLLPSEANRLRRAKEFRDGIR